MGNQGEQVSSGAPNAGHDDHSPRAVDLWRFRGLAKACAWSTALLAAAAIVWFASGVPPAFIGLWGGLVALAWLLVGIAGFVVAVRTHRPSQVPQTSERGSRWRVWTSPWVGALSTVVVLAGMVLLTFVVDGAFPALVLGSDPGRSVAQTVGFREAKQRRDVDRTRITFETSTGAVVETWAADPDYIVGPGTPVVYDIDHPQRAMTERTWEKERAAPWQLPLAVLVWLGFVAAPFVMRRARSRIYGTLQPGLHIVKATRVRRSKLVRLEWDDGSRATFVDVPGFGDAVQRRLHDDGDDIPLPWAGTPPITGRSPWS